MSCFFRYSNRRSGVRQAFTFFVLGVASACVAAAQSHTVTFEAATALSHAPQVSRLLAQTPAPEPANLPGGPLYLSMQQALQMALKNNLDIELEQIDQTIAGLSVPLTQGGGLPRPINYTVADTPSGEAPAAVPLLSFSSPGLSPLSVDPTAGGKSGGQDGQTRSRGNN